MSVLKRFRSESKMQFYATAQKLRRDIMTLLLKDFGVRSKVRQLDIETRHMTQDDRNAFLAIAEKYGIRRQARALGLFISEKKTHITPLQRGFTFDTRQRRLPDCQHSHQRGQKPLRHAAQSSFLSPDSNPSIKPFM